MKKRILSLLMILTFLLSLYAPVSFATTDTSLNNYIQYGINEDFEKADEGSDGWIKDYSSIVKDSTVGNQYMSVDSQKNEHHFIKEFTNLTGIVTFETDYYNNNATSNSFMLGFNGLNYMFLVTAAATIRQGTPNGWADNVSLKKQTWYTIKVVLDTDTGIYNLWYKETADDEFIKVTNKFVDDYYTQNNPFKDGVNYIRMSAYGSGTDSVIKDTLRIDNIKIYSLPHAYTQISKATSADAMVEILNLYALGGYLNLPENYEQVIGKQALFIALKAKTFTSNLELEDTINSLVDGETIYVDMSKHYSADIIAKKGEKIESDTNTFGVSRDKFILDRTDLKRDGYEGQGYNGETLAALQNKDDIISLTKVGANPINIKIPKKVMMLGVNDAAVISASSTKTTIDGLGDRYHKGTTLVIDEFTGRKLSTVNVASFATTINHVWLYADVTYADGETVSYMENTRLPHINQLFGSTCWRSNEIGPAVQLVNGVITEATAVSNPNSSGTTTPEDNYSNSYVSAQQFNLDPNRVIEKFELYNSSLWGSSSVAILGVTGIPSAKTFSIDSESYNFESNSDGWSGGETAVSPTASWNSAYKTASGNTSKLLFANDIQKFVVGDFRIYTESGVKVKFLGSDTEVFKVSSGNLANDGKCDPSLFKNATGKWIDVRFALTEDKLIIYVKDGENYFKINSQNIPSSLLGLEFIADGGNVYVDEVKVQTFGDLYKLINNVSSETLMKSLLEIIVDYGIIKLPISFNYLSIEDIESLIEVLMNKEYESDKELKRDIENAVIKHLSKSTSDELFIYDYDREYNATVLSGLSLIINKDVDSTNAMIFGAAYLNGELTNCISQKITSRLSKYTKIDISDDLNINGADSYKFIFLDLGTLKPLCKNIDVTLISDDVNTNYYPGWVRKTITFSYDDGNYATDEKAIALINEAGMKATFNLYSFNFNKVVSSKGKDTVLALYNGHEIASHSKWHTTAIPSDHDYLKMDAYQNASASYGGQTGIYYYYANYPDLSTKQPRSDDITYKKGIDEGIEDLEKIFGEDKIRGFAYPYSKGSAYKDELKNYASSKHDYTRDSGNDADRKGFELPADWSSWSSTAYYNDLLKNAEKFAALEDDGKLKFFCAGVHTADFNKNPNDGVHSDYWYQLENFCKLYGKNSETYWYATNIEIFDYVNALKSLEISEYGIKNNSSVDVYVTINGKKAVIKAHSIYR